jgi:hypothetical protein
MSMLEETTTITVYIYIYIDNKFYSITEKQFFGGPEKGRIVTVFFTVAANLLSSGEVTVRAPWGRREEPSLLSA